MEAISKKFVQSEQSAINIAKEAYDLFKLMADDARKQNLKIYISSAYRDYDLQYRLYNGYLENNPVNIVDTYIRRIVRHRWPFSNTTHCP